MSAKQNLAESRFLRMKVLPGVLTKFDMTTKENVSQDLRPNRIMENIRNLEKILRSIEENMSSLNEEVIKDVLFNIGTINDTF